MRLFLAAAALVIAAPAAAQTADPHAAHQPAQHHDQSKGHEGHAMMDCCKDKNGNGKPDCSEGKMSCCARDGKAGTEPGHAHH